MVYCFPFLAPLLLIHTPNESITPQVLAAFLVYSIVVHRPCIQCLLLFAIAAALLCLTADHCFIPLYAEGPGLHT
eukprot:m.36565 g.36565  ORF g.36565 m.36565 type:complete len:75 (-) comp5400_c0_seq2:1546-1770(-)